MGLFSDIQDRIQREGFFALHLTLGGKVEICGRDDLFLLFT